MKKTIKNIIKDVRKNCGVTVRYKTYKSGAVRIKSIGQKRIGFYEKFKSNTPRGKYLLRYKFASYYPYTSKQLWYFNRKRRERVAEIQKLTNPKEKIEQYNKILYDTGKRQIASFDIWERVQKRKKWTDAELLHRLDEKNQRYSGYAYTASVETLKNTCIFELRDVFETYMELNSNNIIDHDKLMLSYLNELIDYLEENPHTIDDAKCMNAQQTSKGSNDDCDTLKDIIMTVLDIFKEELNLPRSFLCCAWKEYDRSPEVEKRKATEIRDKWGETELKARDEDDESPDSDE